MREVPVPGMTAGGPAPAQGHWIAPEVSPRWVRVRAAGETIADSKRAVLLREKGRLPIYYFPKADARLDLMAPSGHTAEDANKGIATYLTLRVRDRVLENAAWSYARPIPEWSDIADYVAFEWTKMDAWYEEEEEIFVHPRDPYKRIDALASSRTVAVAVDGVRVAESSRPTLLFETGMPTRYYLPADDVRTGLLQPSETHTRCPYKGLASYWSLKAAETVHPDLVWTYPEPLKDCPNIKGLLAFFNERVDLWVDDELQVRPRTAWSR